MQFGRSNSTFPPPEPAASHQPLELVLGEAHVCGGDAVVEVQAGVEDQRVVCVQGVVGLVLHEPALRRSRTPTDNQPRRVTRPGNHGDLRDDGVLGEVRVTGTCQFTGNRTDL